MKYGTKKKDDDAAGIILVVIGIIAWGIYVEIRALINLNELFIESVSNPARIIGLFFGLLIAVVLIIRGFIYRGFRKKTAEPEQAVSDLAQKEKAVEETVSTEVARRRYRINRINLRKEFFRVELSWIIDEVECLHGQVEYIADPVALQYLQSLEYAQSGTA